MRGCLYSFMFWFCVFVLVLVYQQNPTGFTPRVIAGVSRAALIAQAAAQHLPQTTSAKAEPWPGFGDSECAGLHSGARDYCAPAGTAVVAPYAGVFEDCGSYTDPMRFGAYFVYTDTEGYEQYFGHLEPGSCNPDGLHAGDPVVPGVTRIGVLTNFYNPDLQQYVPHTHWQVKKPDGSLYDPKPLWDSR